MFAPQKGATPPQVDALESGLRQLVNIVGVADAPGAGAAGATAYGFLAWGATLTSGAAAVGSALDLPRLVASAGVVITGEGCYDTQSSAGKVSHYVATLARGEGVDVLLAAGTIRADPAGFTVAVTLREVAGATEAALREPVRWANEAGAKLARIYSALS